MAGGEVRLGGPERDALEGELVPEEQARVAQGDEALDDGADVGLPAARFAALRLVLTDREVTRAGHADGPHLGVAELRAQHEEGERAQLEVAAVAGVDGGCVADEAGLRVRASEEQLVRIAERRAHAEREHVLGPHRLDHADEALVRDEVLRRGGRAEEEPTETDDVSHPVGMRGATRAAHVRCG